MKKMLAAGLLILLPLPAMAQQSARAELTHVDSSYVQVYEHDFVGGTGEFVRLKLEKDHHYRAELSTGGVELQINPVDRSVQAPYLAKTVPGQTVTGGSMYDLRPHATAVYQIKVLDTTSGNATLRILEKQPVQDKAKEKKKMEDKDQDDSTS